MHEFLEPVKLHERAAYGVAQAAEALSVGKSTVWRLIKDGRIKPIQLGGRTIIRRSELDRLLDEAEAAAEDRRTRQAESANIVLSEVEEADGCGSGFTVKNSPRDKRPTGR